ncbi:MAG: amidinotransferase [Alphaproteobacteria bacterium]|nr:amidinotransferase [Alphaproteobacteria bacterium]
MASPRHFEVAYAINPWMRPDIWADDKAGHGRAAGAAFGALEEGLLAAGGEVRLVDGAAGLPDMVFTANAAVVLDGRALLARFRHPERRGEEAEFARLFEGFRREGLLSAVESLPEGLFQEGAGDCVWDEARQLFWGGYGPRSSLQSHRAVAGFFDREVVSLELATQRYYHLDVALSALPGGEVLYYPAAFAPAARHAIADRVPPDSLVAVGEPEAAAFGLNIVCVGRDLVMARTTPRLRAILAERGYAVREVDLDPFLLAGGAAFCLTLRLDRRSGDGERTPA